MMTRRHTPLRCAYWASGCGRTILSSCQLRPFCGLSFRKCCEPGATLLYYNASVEFILREFKREDFKILWDIDQKCFPPGISYSRLELNAYIRRRGSLTLVAESTSRHE